MNKKPLLQSKLLLQLLFLTSILCCSLTLSAQNIGRLEGVLVDSTNRPIEYGDVVVKEYPAIGATIFENGRFNLTELPVDEPLNLEFVVFGGVPQLRQFTIPTNGRLNQTFVVAAQSIPLTVAEIDVEKTRRPSTIDISGMDLKNVLSVGADVEKMIPLVSIGVAKTGNNLSSQYSVRGGNFDENLVYVNGFEIQRPLLIRSGQQEGLSFINPDLVENVSFSAGGFEARYGDKLSSVLDVTYKTPDSLGGSIGLSLLASTVHIEGSHKNWRFMAGYRRKANQYLLNALPTDAVYQPVFNDYQAFVSNQIDSNWSLEMLVSFADNKYNFIPRGLATSMGTVQRVIGLNVGFEGSESDANQTFTGATALKYTSDDNRKTTTLLASVYKSFEKETFDIEGAYWLSEIDGNLGSEDFGRPVRSLGFGEYHNHARNYLEATVADVGYRGEFTTENYQHKLTWGTNYRYEFIDDELSEWRRKDSAFHSLPYSSEEVLFFDVVKSNNSIRSSRVSAFIQDNWVKESPADDDAPDMSLTVGLRANYWTINEELLISPRAQFNYEPKWFKNVDGERLKTPIVFKLASGFYLQPPFYRELRGYNGALNLNLRAQKSWHFVAGMDYTFNAWNRDFRLITEGYYKYMWDLVPYDVEDVKIRYYAENEAVGYATGLDFRLNGEFVPGVESWLNFSLMNTKEDLEGDSIGYFNEADSFLGFESRGFIRRPTNQLFNASVLFTDYLRDNDNIKVNLAFYFGTGMPFGPPKDKLQRDFFVFKPYWRSDISFAMLVFDNSARAKKGKNTAGLWKHLDDMWLSLEVFNLLGIRNTVSNLWIQDNTGTQYAFGNESTGRLVNLQLKGNF